MVAEERSFGAPKRKTFAVNFRNVNGQFCFSGNPPAAVILEAPFTNILDAAAAYPLNVVSVEMFPI